MKDKAPALSINASPSPQFRVMAVIPGDAGDYGGMVFAKREVACLEASGATVCKYFLKSRTSPRVLIAEWVRLRREIALFSPDVIHCHYGTMTSFLTVCATRLPVVVTYRGSDLNPVPSSSIFRVLFGHILSQVSAVCAKKIICVSGELGNRLMWGKRKVAVIPTGVDVEVFKPFSKNEARLRLGLEVNTPLILFNAGRSPKVKRLDLAEASMCELRKLIPKVNFVVLRGDVLPDDVPLYINAADVLFVTSDFEGSPTTVQESIACGLPVVSVDVGDVKERLAGVTPSRIVPRDPVALGSALFEILSLKQRSNGPEVAARELSYKVLITKVIQVLAEAAQRPSKGFFR